MWTCPNCGRSFKNTNQSHFCSKKPATLDEYIAAQPEHAQSYLTQIRNTVKAALPEAQERISWSMPTYWEKHNLVQFAAHKNHIGLYAGPEAVVWFAEELKEYKTSKGAIQLPYDKPLPLDMITKIAVWNQTGGNHI